MNSLFFLMGLFCFPAAIARFTSNVIVSNGFFFLGRQQDRKKAHEVQYMYSIKCLKKHLLEQFVENRFDLRLWCVRFTYNHSGGPGYGCNFPIRYKLALSTNL